MKKTLLAIIVFFAYLLSARAQTLYGTTFNGGNEGGGTVNKFMPATNNLIVSKSFESNDSYPYFTNFIQASDGKLYGMTSNGGSSGYGVIFSFDPSSSIYTKLKDFDWANGANPYGSLMQASDGRLYGMTASGGNSGLGVIFSFDPTSSTYSKLKDFDNTNGASPRGSLVQASDGKLYGMTYSGGSSGYGVIFSFDPSASNYTKLKDFDYANGANPYGSLAQASDGKLYGMTNQGGSSDGGVIFSFDPSSFTYTKLKDFDNTNGAYPYGSLVQASDGKLYGMTDQGGSSGYGVIFSFDPSSFNYTKLKDFDYANGGRPRGSLMQASDGKLYGMTLNGGSSSAGVIFSFDPSSSAYTKLKDFDNTNGATPYGSLMQASDGKLYGMTYLGGSGGRGVIFSFDPSASIYTKLKDFGINETGSNGIASLVQANDGRLYGMTVNGGSSGRGVIFSFDPSSSTYTKLKDFDYANGAHPYGSLMQASDGKLYGMTSQGENSSRGVIFSFDPSSSTYTKLKDFDYTNGGYPYGSLMQASDGKLYGMTQSGGSSGYGVIFSFDPSSSTYTKLKDFDNTNGAYPRGSLMQASDGKLYGMTVNGGSSGYGVIFSFDPSSSTYLKLKDFDVANGAFPYGSLMQASDGKLYGMTLNGGNSDRGVIFSFDPSSSAYTKLKDFDYTNGAHPLGSLMQASDGKLFGMTWLGGSSGNGVIFSFDPSASAYTKLKDFDGANGANPYIGSAFIEVNECIASTTYYQDADGDGYGNPSVSVQACSQPEGHVTDNTDCDDSNASINPGATEICDGKDNDCDGNIDGIPSITSFSPLASSIGSTIAITGSGFDPVSANNIVYFGAVKATVSSASETSLNVIVPSGATYDNISITAGTCNLTAYSNKKFTPVFICNAPISANAFAPKVDFATSTQAQFTTIADLDDDGKSDLGLSQNYLTIFKNTSVNSVINSGTLAPSFDLNSGQIPYGIESADIDGDGKKDILLTSTNSNIFSVYRNISTTGILTNGSFASRVNFATVTNPAGIAVSDIDLDGRPDVVVTNSQEPFSISVFRNTSTPGNISFATKVDIALNGQSYFVKMADLDDDGRPEIIAINTFLSSTIQIFGNLSSPGAIDASSFAAPVSLSSGSSARQPDIADLDGDGKLDIIAPNQDNNNFSVYSNLSTTGTISFAPRVNVSCGSNPVSARCGDIDGDGKVDVVIANNADHTISVYRNNSTPGTLSFGSAFTFNTGVNPYSANIADMDSDGKPEVIVANYTGKAISIFKNQINALAAPVIIASQTNPICPGTTTTLSTSMEYVSYLWSTGETTASINVGEGTYSVTVTDESGCQNSSSYVVTASDDIFPTIQCPQNKTVNVTPGSCSSTVTLDATASDNCSVTLKYYLNYGQQNQTEILSPFAFSVGTSVVTVVATDAGNNEVSCTFSVTVVDNEPPVIPSTPPDVIVDADPGQCSASNVTLGGLNATDNCQIISEIHNAPTNFPIGTTVVKRSVFDAEGNEATVNQNVIVIDNQAPTVVVAPENITVNTDLGQCSASNVSLGNNVSFTDNCPGTVVTNNAPSIYPKGMTTVVWTATDASGNTTTISQTVTVVDNEAPHLVCPSNITVNNNPGQCGAQVFYNIDFSDNCEGGGVWTNAGSGSFFAVGTNTVNLIATDGSGNQTSCSFTITVIDNENPVITYCPVVPVFCNNANQSYTITALTATDNCTVSMINYTITGATSRTGNGGNASGVFNPGTSTINWTVTDVNGNTSTCSTIVVIDKVDVTIPDVFPANITASIGNPNTIYIGYGGSSVTLSAQVISSVSPDSYSYKWTISSPAGPGFASTPNITVSPTTTTTYYLSIKDNNNCAPLYQVSKQINVIDITCGTGKIWVCEPQKNGTYSSRCVSSADKIIRTLKAGWYLGQCPATTTAAKGATMTTEQSILVSEMTVTASPNPTTQSFSIIVHSSNKKEKIAVRVVDILGRVIANRNLITEGKTFKLGENYSAGIYLVEAIQGKERKTLMLIKQ